MLSCLRLDKAADVEFLTFEVSLIYLSQTAESETMDHLSYLRQQSSGCYYAYQTSLSSFGHHQQQVNSTSLYFSVRRGEVSICTDGIDLSVLGL